MNNEKFIEDLLASKFLDRIIGDKDVKLISIAGSRIFDIVDDRSDYDLLVVVSEDEDIPYYDMSYYEYFIYDNKKVHWYYMHEDDFLGNDLESVKNFYRLQNIFKFYLKADDIILNNTSGTLLSFLENPLENMEEELKEANDHYFDFVKERVKTVINDGEIKEDKYSKNIYRWCLIHSLRTGETLDKEFLNRIKRMRWTKPTQEDLIKAFDMLVEYNKSFEEVGNGNL